MPSKIPQTVVRRKKPMGPISGYGFINQPTQAPIRPSGYRQSVDYSHNYNPEPSYSYHPNGNGYGHPGYSAQQPGYYPQAIHPAIPVNSYGMSHPPAINPRASYSHPVIPMASHPSMSAHLGYPIDPYHAPSPYHPVPPHHVPQPTHHQPQSHSKRNPSYPSSHNQELLNELESIDAEISRMSRYK